MTITNNVFDLSPIMIFDDTSEVVFDNNDILLSFNDSNNSNDSNIEFDCTASEKRLLYLSKGMYNNDTNDKNNDCTDLTNPCTMWSQIQREITSGDIVLIYIDKGSYYASSGIDIDLNNGGGGILFDVKNYVIIGGGAEKTVIEFSDYSDCLFDFDGLKTMPIWWICVKKNVTCQLKTHCNAHTMKL